MNWSIFFSLIQRELCLFRREYIGKITDILITFIVWVVVFGFFVPQMGTESNYGVFIMVGAIASFGIFDVIGQTGQMITDIQNDRTVSYLLLLPIRTFYVFCYRALSWGIQTLLIAIPMFFLGKLLFWKEVPLSQVNWTQLAISLVVINLFLGFFSLWLVSMLHKVRDLNRIYFRFR